MKKGWNWFWAFLSSTDDGMSMKRVVTAVITFCVAHLHYRFVDANNVITVIKVDELFILILLGIVALPEILKIWKGGTDDKPVV